MTTAKSSAMNFLRLWQLGASWYWIKLRKVDSSLEVPLSLVYYMKNFFVSSCLNGQKVISRVQTACDHKFLSFFQSCVFNLELPYCNFVIVFPGLDNRRDKSNIDVSREFPFKYRKCQLENWTLSWFQLQIRLFESKTKLNLRSFECWFFQYNCFGRAKNNAWLISRL